MADRPWWLRFSDVSGDRKAGFEEVTREHFGARTLPITTRHWVTDRNGDRYVIDVRGRGVVDMVGPVGFALTPLSWLVHLALDRRQWMLEVGRADGWPAKLVLPSHLDGLFGSQLAALKAMESFEAEIRGGRWPE